MSPVLTLCDGLFLSQFKRYKLEIFNTFLVTGFKILVSSFEAKISFGSGRTFATFFINFYVLLKIPRLFSNRIISYERTSHDLSETRKFTIEK